MSNGSAVRVLNHRHTHTDGTDSITWTSDVGGKNLWGKLYDVSREYYKCFKLI